MEQLFEKYANIQIFATQKDFRGYELLDDTFLQFEDFKNKMQTTGYIMHKFLNPKRTDDNQIDIYLFKPDSKYLTSTINFKKILDQYDNKSIHNIIMITKEELSVYRKKSVKQYTNINLKNYLHKHFIIQINKGPLCSKHSILSIEETRKMCFDLMTHGHKLPGIFIDDPQNIWIGGEINDIIKIESFSEMTGLSIRYRVVTPTSGKVAQSMIAKNLEDEKEEIKKEITQKLEKSNEDDDENEDEIEEELNEYEEDYVDEDYD